MKFDRLKEQILFHNHWCLTEASTFARPLRQLVCTAIILDTHRISEEPQCDLWMMPSIVRLVLQENSHQ